VFDLAARRQLNRGYNDGLTRAVEIVATPLLFGWLGYLLDGWVGIRPVFTIVLAAIGVSGIFVKLWLRYDHEMRAHEAGAVWSRPRRPVPTAEPAGAGDVGAEAPPGGGSPT
jgi:hypothetical protein